MIFQNYCFRSVVLEELLHFFGRVHFFVRQNRTTAPIDEGRRGFKESKTESARCYINRENTLRFFRLRSRHVLSALNPSVLRKATFRTFFASALSAEIRVASRLACRWTRSRILSYSRAKSSTGETRRMIARANAFSSVGTRQKCSYRDMCSENDLPSKKARSSCERPRRRRCVRT